MGKFIRGLLAVVVGILVLAAVVFYVGVPLFFNAERFKPRIEQAASQALGMQVAILGKISVRTFPSTRIILRDVRLENLGSRVFQANEVEVSPRLIPLVLHHEVAIRGVSVQRPTVRIEKLANGRMNYEPEAGRRKQAAGEKAQPSTAGGSVGSVTVSDGDVVYVDHGSGQTTEIKGLDLKLSGISWGREIPRSVKAHGSVRARSLRSGKIAVSDLRSDLRDDESVVTLSGMRAVVFGGTVQGHAKADLRGAVPQLELAQTASHIDLGQLTAGSKTAASGFADGSLELGARGKEINTLLRSANGAVAIRSEGVTIQNLDVDRLIGTAQSVEKLDLSSLGSLVTGPLGNVATGTGKAAGTAAKTGQEATHIRKLVADWKIVNGVAETRDVAIATEKHTVAFRGNVDLVTRRFENFYAAVVDPRGCAKLKQEIGTVTHPKPNLAQTASQTAQSATRALGGEAAKALGGKGGQAGSVGSMIEGMLGQPRTQPAPTPGKTPGEAPAQQQPGAAPSPQAQACDEFYHGSALS